MPIRLSRLIGDRRGATAIEYGLIVALIAIASVAGFRSVADGSGSVWGHILDGVTTALG